jgi:hypothetical protein
MNLAQHVLGNRYPGRIALVCGDEQVTREELAVRVARTARALRTPLAPWVTSSPPVSVFRSSS